MFLTRSEYDRGVNTFSPEGRLFQVEYAIETVKLGATSIGIRTKEGVVLAAEKRASSKLLVNDSLDKISKVDEHIGTTFAGLIADSRTLVNHARQEAQNFWFTFNRKIRVEDVTQSVANLALHFGDDDSKIRMGRPFGVALLFAGVDKTGPRLFHLDPSGTFIDCLAKSIGAACDGAEQNLKEKYHEDITLLEAEKLALTILKQVMEDKLDSLNVEVVVMTPVVDSEGIQSGKFHRLTKEELEAIVTDL
ncbi:proteasome subunit domain-containing protein [Ditylenchus destructor]|uniref:Proteasome subunit alpha type-5 n=1 Tax=Ditylenchus destructor TaxID=166010 RepID=A0AAD4NDZ0_9BILA|nr:proteasome subunit domain-containing protein [Ditylenchus destructor]